MRHAWPYLTFILGIGLGIWLGLHLPQWRQFWLGWRARRAFRTRLLQPYRPPGGDQS
jgi:hypothetical protein